LGSAALKALLPELKATISQVHGQPFTKSGIVFVPLTSPGSGTASAQMEGHPSARHAQTQSLAGSTRRDFVTEVNGDGRSFQMAQHPRPQDAARLGAGSFVRQTHP
jgi:hypothetical protein